MDEKLKVVLNLIQDEIEAVEGYKRAINEFQDEDVRKKLTEIMEDELEHIKELDTLIFKL